MKILGHCIFLVLLASCAHHAEIQKEHTNPEQAAVVNQVQPTSVLAGSDKTSDTCPMKKTFDCSTGDEVLPPVKYKNKAIHFNKFADSRCPDAVVVTMGKRFQDSIVAVKIEGGYRVINLLARHHGRIVVESELKLNPNGDTFTVLVGVNNGQDISSVELKYGKRKLVSEMTVDNDSPENRVAKFAFDAPQFKRVIKNNISVTLKDSEEYRLIDYSKQQMTALLLLSQALKRKN